MRTGIRPQVILCISGHDPTGGAGIQADIETIAALGGHAATAITCLTVQDTQNLTHLVPSDPALMAQQLTVLCSDMVVSAVKIGLLGSSAIAGTIERFVSSIEVPIVLDPVLCAGGGADLADRELLAATTKLLPKVGLLTPNRHEARLLTGVDDPVRAATRLTEQGPAVLLTGADEAHGQEVINLLFENQQQVQEYRWTRLPHTYHGSGCTLASACAFFLAHHTNLRSAAANAQSYTQEALRKAQPLGRGQWLPRRI